MFARWTIVVALALALTLPAGAPARNAALSAPTGLKAFLLRYSEPTRHEFPRTPSFAWSPVPGATRYEFQLASSSNFRDNSIVWDSSDLAKAPTVPVISVPIALPWVTGNPYSLYARVRARTQKGTTPWSADFGFNVRWPQLPAQLPSPPGILRWTPVDGATGYEVWERNMTGANTAVIYSKWYFVATNVTDMRDWYTFHQNVSWYGTATWRVRAVRLQYGSTRNDTGTASYGPWSPVYTTTTQSPSPVPGPMTLGGTISDLTGTIAVPKPHALMPGFYWSGNQSLYGDRTELSRVYIFSDRDCVNPVYIGAAVGSPGWVPRASGPLSLPIDPAKLAEARKQVLPDAIDPDTGAIVGETKSFGLDRTPLVPTETPPTNSQSASSGTSTADEGATITPPSSLTNPFPREPQLDLWDRAWPSGAYYWTVVPVERILTDPVEMTLTAAASAGSTTITVSGALTVGETIAIAGESGGFTVISVSGSTVGLDRPLASAHAIGTSVATSSRLEYWDTELPQDACSAGRVGMFGKISQPIAAGGKTPYVTGLSSDGDLETASGTKSPIVYGNPLVAWQPALGADQYEIQWSDTKYPFDPVGQAFSASTAASLVLNPGVWYYRVRGINFQMPKNARAMAWSKVQKLTVVPPVFAITGNSSGGKGKKK
jgi:hypothetical protein